eukprot:scaffold9117_cov92-Isochrysis_galbana.AAC.1
MAGSRQPDLLPSALDGLGDLRRRCPDYPPCPRHHSLLPAAAALGSWCSHSCPHDPPLSLQHDQRSVKKGGAQIYS